MPRLTAGGVVGRLGGAQHGAVECVASMGGATARELGARFSPSAPKKLAPRLVECRALGLLVNGAVRRCRVTGQPALTWYLAPIRERQGCLFGGE